MIGIILMVIGHCNLALNIPYLTKTIYLFHMPLFIIISGILFKKIKISLSFKKYSKAYIIPYLTMALATIIVVIPCSMFLGLDLYEEISTFLLAICLGHGSFGLSLPAIGVGWFLCALFSSLIVYNFLSNYLRLAEKSIVVIIIFGVIWASSRKLFIPFSIQAGFTSMLFLLIGEFINKYRVLEYRLYNQYLMYILFSIIVCLGILYGGLSVSACTYINPIITIPACLVMCYLTFIASKRLVWLGG